MKNNFFLLSVGFFFILWNGLGAVQAQDTAPSQPNSEGYSEAQPTPDSIAEISLPQNRVVKIHRQSRAKTGVNNIYFHRPLFALVEQEQPLEGYPAIVQEAEQDAASGQTFLRFTVQVSAQGIRDFCKAQILEKDQNLRKEELNPDLIEVRRWPLKHAIIECSDRLTKKLLGRGTTDPLGGMGDQWDISLAFSPEDLKVFRAKAGNGGVQFQFSYTYENVMTQSAERAMTASVALEQVVGRAVNSQHLNPAAPICQDQFNQVEQQVRRDLRETVKADSQQALALLEKRELKLYEDQWIEMDKLNDTDFFNKLAEYLKPLIQTAQTVSENSSTTKSTTEKEKNETVQIDVGEKFSAVLGDSKYNISKKDIEKLENDHGVKFANTENTQWYRPHQIRVYRLNRSLQTNAQSILQQAFLAVGTDKSYYADSPVRSDFTKKRVGEELTGQTDRWAYAGVRLGMMLPYFGEELPAGFEWADGKKNWPNEPWVPQHLRGKPLPNMEGLLVGGTVQEQEVGTAWNQGKLKFAIDVQGSNFATAAPTADPTITVNALSIKSMGFNPPGAEINEILLRAVNT